MDIMRMIRDEEELISLFIQEEMNEMATKPLLQTVEIGQTIDFTAQRKGRLCNSFGDKVQICPHCKRLGMRYQLIGGRIRYTHVGRKGEITLESLDACYMWPRTEHKLQFGSDSIHPKLRRPGDEDMSVEEVRQ